MQLVSRVLCPVSLMRFTAFLNIPMRVGIGLYKPYEPEAQKVTNLTKKQFINIVQQFINLFCIYANETASHAGSSKNHPQAWALS